MNGWRLFRWVLRRGIFSGAVLGALFGMAITSIYTISGAVAVCFISLFVGAILGAGVGGILGVIDALALVILTRLFFNPARSKRRYRWSALLVAITFTLPTSFIAAYILFGDLPYIFVPVTVLASITTGFFAWRLPDADSPPPAEAHLPLANAVLFYIQK